MVGCSFEISNDSSKNERLWLLVRVVVGFFTFSFRWMIWRHPGPCLCIWRCLLHSTWKILMSLIFCLTVLWFLGINPTFTFHIRQMCCFALHKKICKLDLDIWFWVISRSRYPLILPNFVKLAFNFYQIVVKFGLKNGLFDNFYCERSDKFIKCVRGI